MPADDDDDRVAAIPLLTGVVDNLALLKPLKNAAKTFVADVADVVCPVLADETVVSVGVGVWALGATATELDLETSGIDVSPRRGAGFVEFDIGRMIGATATSA